MTAPDKTALLVERLREAYSKVAEWPEKRMREGAVLELGIGFNDLLELRNLTPEAATLLLEQQAEIERLRAALNPFAEYADLAMRGRGDDFIEVGVWTTDDQGKPAHQELTALHFRAARSAMATEVGK